MFNKVKKIMLFCGLFMAIIFITITAKALLSSNINNPIENIYNETPLFGNDIYLSNRYAQPDDLTLVASDNFIDESYQLIAENKKIQLYLNKETFEFKIKNLQTGYVWNSSGQNLKEGGLNATNRDILQSPVYIEYYPYIEKTDELVNTIKRASAYDAKLTFIEIVNGVKVNLDYKKIDISFDFVITLEDNGIVVSIDNDTIRENNNKIAAIYLFSNFGSTYEDTIPGYMFIPDGPGALYRFKNNSQLRNVVQYSTRIFDNDIGISNTNINNYISHISMPIYGMVHGVNQNAFIAIIEEGLYNSVLSVNPSGANGINYNWLGVKFIFRESYIYPTNLKGDGVTLIQEEKNNEDLKIRILFTDEKSSNYVGMARLYQEYLVNEGILQEQNTDVKLRVEILATDSENGLFGPKSLKMTNVNEAEAIINKLYEEGIKDLVVVFRGWNDDGMSGESPYEIKFESKFGKNDEIKNCLKTLAKNNIEFYFYNDYVKGFETSNVVNPRNDFARGLYKRKIENSLDAQMYDKYYYLYPTSSYDLAKSDIEKYNDLEINNLAIDSIGYHLFSTLNNNDKINNRFDNALIYQDTLQMITKTKKVSLYRPNSYLWQYTSNYFDIPMYNSQINIYDDTVPFLQIVLKGYIDYYSPFFNFFSNPQEQILMMIDYGIYPSYIVTQEPTYKLNYTNANTYFTTEFSLWENKIVEQYYEIANVLNQVSGEKIKSRIVIDIGVVEVGYENDMRIIINYTDEDYIYEGQEVEAKGFLTLGMGGQ